MRRAPASAVVRAILVLVVVFEGCAPARIHEAAGTSTIRGYPCPDPPCFARGNHDILTETRSNTSFRGSEPVPYAWSYKKEWAFNRDSEGPPQVCLAMSGGGIRSAAFNIGVLGALHESLGPNGSRLLDNLDVISGVSGGSSALSWYYTQQYHLRVHSRQPGDVRVAMFRERDDPSGAATHQRYLAENYTTFNTVEYGVGAALNGLLIPTNLFANGVFGWHANTSPMRAWYERRLRKTFQRDPLGKDPSGEGELIALPTLLKFLEEERAQGRRLPLPVIGTTALIERDFQHFGARLGNSVFEFTPMHFGSDAFARHPYETDAGRSFTLSRVVSISSAAFDGAALVSGPTQTTLWSVLNWDTGMYVDNPNVSRWDRLKHRFWPFPFYFSDHYLRDVHGTDVYLSDGGHADNLAAYPLIRRRCGKIVIVDAEHDPSLIFESYFRLRNDVRAELNVVLDVDGIAEVTAVEDLRPMGRRWEQVAKRPVMRGSISSLPYQQLGGRIGPKIEVLYIKMVYLPAMMFPIPDPERRRAIDRVFDKDRDKACKIDARYKTYVSGPCPFPHGTTTDQDFTPAEYEAWRNLGRVLASGYADEIKSFFESR